MKLTHHSYVSFTSLRDSNTYDIFNGRGAYKPKGLWLSVNDGWRDFCKADERDLPSRTYEISLKEKHNLLVLPNLPAIEEFTKKWVPDDDGTPRWRDLFRAYSGLLIPFFSHSISIDFCWWYAWDCASGVVWKPSEAIASFKLLEVKELVE